MKKRILFFFLFCAHFVMSQNFDTNKVLNQRGVLLRTAPESDLLSVNGHKHNTLLTNKTVDRWGNIMVAQTFIGYQNFGFDISTHQQSWSSSGQTLPLSLPVSGANTVTLGCIANTEIIATGSLVTTSQLVIAGTSRQIHSGSPGNQFGGGTVTLVDPQTVGMNGITDINVDNGATLKLGTDWTKKHGWFYSPGGHGQMLNRGTLEIRSLSYTDIDLQVGGNMTATSITRYIGKPDGTSFYNTCASPNTYGQTFLNLGLLEIDNCAWRPRIIATAGPGTIRLKDGGCLITTMNSASQKVFISGDGGNAPDFPKVAFGIEYGKNFYSTSNIELEADATIAYQGKIVDYLAGFGYFPPIISTIDKTLTIGCPTVGGSITAGWGDLAYTAFTVANPNLLGPVKVAYGQLRLDVAAAMPNAAYLELTGNGSLNNATTNSIKSIRSTSSTTEVNVVAGLTLIAQEATPVSALFKGAQNVTLQSGELLMNRTSQTMTGTIWVQGKIGSVLAQTQLAGGLNFYNANGTLKVSNVGGSASRLNCTALTVASGFKVDIDAGITAGTYTILSKTSGSSVVPTMGVNNSGLTASFAWVGNNLILTLI